MVNLKIGGYGKGKKDKFYISVMLLYILVIYMLTGKYERKLKKIKCSICGESILTKGNSTKFCKKCKQKKELERSRKRYVPKKPREIICVICGKIFYSKQSGAKYCSYGCHMKGNRINGKKYYRNNIEKSRKKGREHARRHIEKHPDWYLYYAAKRRAKLKGMEFSIDKEDIVIPKNCPILGIKLVRGKRTMSDSSPSVDRINNNLGYIKGNIAIMSFRANSIKQDATIEELEAISKWLKLQQNNNKE